MSPTTLDDRPVPQPKLWKNGTLVYTTAGLVALFGWLLFGDFALQLQTRSTGDTAKLVLRAFKASDFLVGLLMGSVPAAIGMLLVPVIATRSDRHRGRWGRRIPFILVPLPFMVASMAGLAFGPTIGHQIHAWLGEGSPGINTCVLGTFAVCWATFEVFGIMTTAVFGGLINDVVPHAVIGRFFGLFRMVSLIDGIIFNYFIIEHAETRYFWIFVGTGLFYGLGFMLMCLNVKEGVYPPPEPLDKIAHPGRLQAVRSYLRECYTTPFYLWVFLATIACGMSFGPVNSFSLFYAKSLGMSLSLYGKYVAASYVCSLALAYFLGSLADRFHPLRLGIVFIGLYALITLFGAAFATDSRTFGFAFLAHTIISGAYFTAMASLGQRLYPKLKFAQFASAAGLLGAVCGGMLPPAMGLILDASGHNYRLTFLSSGILALAGLLGLTVVHHKFIRLGGPRHYVPPHVGPALPATLL